MKDTQEFLNYIYDAHLNGKTPMDHTKITVTAVIALLKAVKGKRRDIFETLNVIGNELIEEFDQFQQKKTES